MKIKININWLWLCIIMFTIYAGVDYYFDKKDNSQIEILHKQIHNLENWTQTISLDTCKINFIETPEAIYSIHIEKFENKK